MTDPLDQFNLLFGAQPSGVSPFPDTSRYAGLPTKEFTTADGRVVRYVGRRFLPDPRSLSTLAEHRVQPGERLDHLAAHYFADPELFWRILDANPDVTTDDATATPGRVLRIAEPGYDGA